MSTPQPPLKPTYRNERARIAEHDMFMAESRRIFCTDVICPDCYHPPSHCKHFKPYDRRKK